jgi:hypothetical protein
MFEGLKRFVRRIEKALEPDPIDVPRPQRVNPDPPKDNWYARTAKRSLTSAAKNETAALEQLDKLAPRLSRESSEKVDDLLAKASASAARR